METGTGIPVQTLGETEYTMAYTMTIRPIHDSELRTSPFAHQPSLQCSATVIFPL